MNFLRNLLASILGCLIAFGVIFVMFTVFVSVVGNIEETVTIKKGSILELQLQRPINDYVGDNQFDPFASLFEQAQGLDEILHAIEVAKDDGDIAGISITNNFIMAGLAQTQAIRKALSDFKESGKFIYAYADYYLQKDYYLASVADSVFLNPVGAVDFRGLASEVLFFKEFQEKTGIKIEVVRHGKYKSAVEPFLADEMSEANRRQIEELIESLWVSMVDDIAQNRNLSDAQLNTIADTLGGRTPEYAQATGLIDRIDFYDGYEASLSRAVAPSADEEANIIGLDDYVIRSNRKILRKGKDKVAIVFAQGEILYGEGGPDVIGQGIIVEALRKARDDEDVKAIVLRVNSPGGSALTSDIIWREIQLAKEEKPVVASMGNTAASGGYYIAVGAERIFAEPTTVTGSIGVFGTIPNIAGLADKVGINAEQVGTNRNSVEYSLFEPLDENFRKVVQEGIEDTYETFLQRVAEGRNMTVAEVDSLAQGRVWSGTLAQELGLVDDLGNLHDAIEAAADLAGLEDYGIKKYPKYKSGLERFFEDVGGAEAEVRENLIKEEIGGEWFALYKQFKNAMEREHIQTRMPFVLDIK